MLLCLRIKNLAVIDDLSWELEPGLSILTGETGAGKSILIDAFNLLLGERADKTLIRDGTDQCTVEAVLAISASIIPFLNEQGIEFTQEEGLILKRTFNIQGQNRQFINGSPTTLQVLKSLGNLLVDMHGPHDHQSLFSSKSQLAALDAFGKTNLEEYQSLYQDQLNDLNQLEELKKTENGDWQSRLDFLQFQMEEIERAHLQFDEEGALEHDYQIGTHHRRIVEIAENIRQTLGESEQDIFGKLETIARLLQEWEKLDTSASSLNELNQGALAQLRELENESQHLVENTELDAQQLQEIENRLNLIQSLKRKHGNTIVEILAKFEKMKQERDFLAGREANISKLEEVIQHRQAKLEQLANKISQNRKKSAPKLAEEISNQLRELNFKQANFNLEIQTCTQLSSHGKDEIEFLFAPNPGESARALRAIASSGEMARVMLAIKTVLAKHDQVPILIFDEIDANVGGETAVVVGKKLKELSKSHQILCITHLPQVAAAGNIHYRVEKKIQNGRTITQIERLDNENRMNEISRMLGGQSKSAQNLAKSLLTNS